MSRRRRGGQKAHPVGTRLERRFERLGRGQAADFDEQGHVLDGYGLKANGGPRVRGRKTGFSVAAASTTSRAACLARRARKAPHRRERGGAGTQALLRQTG